MTVHDGERVIARCLPVELESSDGRNDTMPDPEHKRLLASGPLCRREPPGLS